MKSSPAIAVTVAGVAATTIMSALAQPTTPSQVQTQTQGEAREQVYGSQLMTRQERNAYRQRMHELKTQQERDQFRMEHHARMQERAKERGVSLLQEPPVPGRGAGPRNGMGPGMGHGAGQRGPGAGAGRP